MRHHKSLASDATKSTKRATKLLKWALSITTSSYFSRWRCNIIRHCHCFMVFLAARWLRRFAIWFCTARLVTLPSWGGMLRSPKVPGLVGWRRCRQIFHHGHGVVTFERLDLFGNSCLQPLLHSPKPAGSWERTPDRSSFDLFSVGDFFLLTVLSAARRNDKLFATSCFSFRGEPILIVKPVKRLNKFASWELSRSNIDLVKYLWYKSYSYLELYIQGKLLKNPLIRMIRTVVQMKPSMWAWLLYFVGNEIDIWWQPKNVWYEFVWDLIPAQAKKLHFSCWLFWFLQSVLGYRSWSLSP